jgi:hypothetical protein
VATPPLLDLNTGPRCEDIIPCEFALLRWIPPYTPSPPVQKKMDADLIGLFCLCFLMIHAKLWYNPYLSFGTYRDDAKHPF